MEIKTIRIYIIYIVNTMLLFIIISLTNMCCPNNREPNQLTELSSDSSADNDTIKDTITLLIESCHGTRMTINTDTIDGWYAQAIKCYATAVIHGYALEDADNEITESNFMWLSKYPYVDDYAIKVKALSSEERTIMGNAVNVLENTYEARDTRIHGSPKFKLYVNDKLVARLYPGEYKEVSINLQRIIDEILTMAEPLWQVDGMNIQKEMNSEFYDVIRDIIKENDYPQ